MSHRKHEAFLSATFGVHWDYHLCIWAKGISFHDLGELQKEKENLVFSTGATVMPQSTSKELWASGPPPAHCLKPSPASDHAQPKEVCGSVFFTSINSYRQTSPSGCFRSITYLINGHLVFSLSTLVFCFVTTLQIQWMFCRWGNKKSPWNLYCFI